MCFDFVNVVTDVEPVVIWKQCGFYERTRSKTKPQQANVFIQSQRSNHLLIINKMITSLVMNLLSCTVRPRAAPAAPAALLKFRCTLMMSLKQQRGEGTVAVWTCLVLSLCLLMFAPFLKHPHITHHVLEKLHHKYAAGWKRWLTKKKE